MQNWERELRENNIQKAIDTELSFDLPIEEIVKGKAHPLGTKRVWGGVEYEKKTEGWMPTGKKEGIEKREIQDPNDPVIKDPDKFKVVSEKTPNPHNPTHYSVDYKINGVSVCTVKKYSDAFCSIEHGRPSNIRNTRKTCYSTNWNPSGIRKVTGIDHVDTSRRGEFRGSYPDTTWGDVGGMESVTGVKEKIAAFIKQNRIKADEKKETEEERLNRLVKDVPDNGGTAHLMRKQTGVEEKKPELPKLTDSEKNIMRTLARSSDQKNEGGKFAKDIADHYKISLPDAYKLIANTLEEKKESKTGMEHLSFSELEQRTRNTQHYGSNARDMALEEIRRRTRKK